MPEIAFDESGNTGADLLNDHQPVFTLASTCISREVADRIVRLARTPQSHEVKFTRLKKSQAGRRRIIDLISSPELGREDVITTFVYKRYMVVTKIVDLLVETVAHEDGIDLYKNGANIALSNLHYLCMPAFCGSERTTHFLTCFVEMIRTQTPTSIQRFYAAAWALHDNSTDGKYTSALAPILASESFIDFILASNDKNSLDPAIPAFVQHCTLWGDRFGGEFDLVHDESKPIFQQQGVLEDIMSQGEKEELIGYDRRKFIFPLRARGICFGRSQDDPRLQVADILASASSYWMNGRVIGAEQNEFWHEIDRAGIGNFCCDALMPTEAMSPQELGTEHDGGINVPDHIARFLLKNRQ